MLNKVLSRFNIFSKIAILGGVITVFFVMVAVLVYFQASTALMESKQSQVHFEVETATSVVLDFLERSKSGSMTTEEAQAEALSVVKNLRYAGGNYFWINDTRPYMVMHPIKPELDGADLSENQDPTGKHLFVEFAKVALSNGEGFVDYMWPKPGFEEDVRKSSYIMYVEEWDWIIGSGMYLDDVEAEIGSIATLIFITVGLIVLIIIGFTVVLARSISSPLSLVVEGARRFSVGDFFLEGMDHEAIGRINEGKDEVGDIGRAFTQLIEFLQTKTKVAKKIANGDLTVTHKAASDADGLGQALETMIQNFRSLIGDVSNNANALTKASHQLATASEQSGEAANQISSTVQQVAVGNQQQADSITETASSIDQMATAITGIAQGAQEQAGAIASSASLTNRMSASVTQVSVNAKAGVEASEQTAKNAKEGSHTIELNLQAMSHIKEKVDLSAEKVKLMGERSDEIGQILGTITDIASQTNMLALNAAIEAARAGEHGKGFAVVADEVRRLAEHSAEATEEIAKLIEGIHATVEEAVTAMNESAAEVETGVVTANDAGIALESILTAADEVNLKVNEINSASSQMETFANELVGSIDSVSAVVEENTAATEEMSASSNEVSRAIEDISSVSEENSAAMEEVSASTEEMSAQVEEVAASANELSGMAQQLTVLISQFKLDQNQDLALHVDVFKEAHEAWAHKLDDVLGGSLKLEPSNIDDHHDCILGKWYYGRAAMECKDFSSYQQLESPHIKLHEYVKESVSAYNRGDEVRARKIAMQVSGYVDQVVSLLDAFKDECKHNNGGSNGKPTGNF